VPIKRVQRLRQCLGERHDAARGAYCPMLPSVCNALWDGTRKKQGSNYRGQALIPEELVFGFGPSARVRGRADGGRGTLTSTAAHASDGRTAAGRRRSEARGQRWCVFCDVKLKPRIYHRTCSIHSP
jgi:hypothetical protein